MPKDGEVVSDFDALHAAVKASARGTLAGVDVAGILLAIKAPKPSRKDMFMSLIITDGRPNSFGTARRLSVNIFAASAQAFPQPENIGDLVYLQNARVSLFQNAPQATLSLHKNNLISIIARSVRDPSHESGATDTERAAARRKMRLRGGVPSGLVSVAGKAKCQPPSNFAETLERLRTVSDALLADQSLQSATGMAMETLPRLANAVCPGSKAGYFFDHILVRVVARGAEHEGSPSFQITDASLAPSSALLRMVSQRCVDSSALREIPNGCWVLLYNVQKYREDDDKLVLTWIQDRSMGLRVSHLGRTREGKEIEFREVTRAEAILDAADFIRLPSSASTSSKHAKLLKTSNMDPVHAGSGPSSSSSSSSSIPSASSRRMSCVAGLIREVGADVGPLRVSPRSTLMEQSQSWHLEARVTAVFPPLARISALLNAGRIKPGHDLMLRFEDSTGVLEVLFAIEDLMAIFERGKKVSSLDASFATWTPNYLGRMLVPGAMSDFVLTLA